MSNRFGVSPDYIRVKASKEKWPTPERVARAANSPDSYEVTDPARAIADLWLQRKEEHRENCYNGARKALERFWALSPVPQTFQEAQIAERLAAKAIDPSEGREPTQTNVNLAVLTSSDFKPKPVVDI